VALSQKVDSNFNSLVTTLASLLDSLGKPVTGTPFVPSSTAAADTKAS